MAAPLMYMPFRYGESWYCTQGQGGSYSHHGNQYWAFDFNKGSNVSSSANPAYNQRIYSPITGEIVEIRDGVIDFQNNSTSNAGNHWGWGNTIVIKDQIGVYYLRIAHIKYGSMNHLNVGDWLEQGDYIGRVGQTGYSTSPHMHIQIQTRVRGSSVKFTFAEGKLYTGEWITSKLGTKLSMTDNNGDVSLSHDFYLAYTQKFGSWGTISTIDDYAGENYQTHYVMNSFDQSYFKWKFWVKTSGYHVIYATYPIDPQNDPHAQYDLNGQKTRYIDQRRGNGFYHFIGLVWMTAGSPFYIKLKGKTTSKYVVADSIVLKRL